MKKEFFLIHRHTAIATGEKTRMGCFAAVRCYFLTGKFG